MHPIAATIGNFDGLHRGHHAVIQQLVQKAKALSAVPTVITFEPLPYDFFHPETPLLRLTTLRQKCTRLAKWGIEQVIGLRFNQPLATLSAEDFVRKYLIEAFELVYMMVGTDFRFGHQQRGDVSQLKSLDVRVEALPLLVEKTKKISSTAIREMLLNDDFEGARYLLGRPYALEGRVIRGAQRGRQWGFPTANLRWKITRPIVKGVFVTTVSVEGVCYHAVTNVGRRPTLDNQGIFIESHLLNFSGDLYGKRITVHFLHKIRSEKKFEKEADLRQQIKEDVAFSQNYFQHKEEKRN
jgi:riboflavin kinase/FMN adenylyltransferase